MVEVLFRCGLVYPVVTANQMTAPDGTLTRRACIVSSRRQRRADFANVYQSDYRDSGAIYAQYVWVKGNVGGEQIIHMTRRQWHLVILKRR